MRILFPYEDALPSPAADAEVFVHTAAAIARLGHDATLLAPQTHRDGLEWRREVAEYYGIEGPLRIEDTPALTHVAPLNRAIQAATLHRHVRFDTSHVVYTRALTTASAALLGGQRVVFDHYRPWGDQFPALQPLLRRVVGHKHFVGMVTHSEYSRVAYKRIGVPDSMMMVAHNGFDPARLLPVLTQAQARAALGLPIQRRIVVYAGRIHERKGLDVVLDMARLSPETLFLLVGSTEHGAIEQEAETLGNVRIESWKTNREVAPFVYAADVLVIPPSSEPLEKVGDTVLPMKLFLYLAAGRPILAGDSPDIAEVLRHNENAVIVPNGDPEAATIALHELWRDQDRIERIGRAGQSLLAGHTWDARAAAIVEFATARLLSLGAAGAELESWSAREFGTEVVNWIGRGLRDGSWVNKPDE